MAYEQYVYDISRQAAADYFTTSYQYYIMKLNSDARAELAGAANAASLGPLQNKPKIYEAAEVRMLGISKVICGGNITIGNKVTGDSDSKAVEAAATEYYIGKALETGIDGRIISILMEHGYMPAG